MANKFEGVEIKSFKEILELQSDDKKLAASKAKTLIIKKEAKISSQVKGAQVAWIEAQEKLNDALISETGDEAAAIQNVKKAKDTYDSYKAIYDALFPNA